jgi:DNA invertase Pin-like site-specific DNA recombinase
MTAVLIYTRLSTEDVHDATVRQEVACRAYAEARNWDVAATLSDLDASAYQSRPRRPGFETLIAEAAARSADGILVWKLDRLASPQGLRTTLGGGGTSGSLHRVGHRAR